LGRIGGISKGAVGGIPLLVPWGMGDGLLKKIEGKP